MTAEPPDWSFGAILLSPYRTRFRLWAPDAESIVLTLPGRDDAAMERRGDGWWEREVSCGAGTHYRYLLPSGGTVPDPASRLQADDVHGDCVVVDHERYRWLHPEWAGRPWHEAIMYELHVGSMGGFAGVTARLEYLAKLGVTAIELMPIAEFPGPHNWGYDGVLLFAPDAAYGTIDELKTLVDTAHGLGLMVLLDVVYNHFGPEGNRLGQYAKTFYRSDHATPWGEAIDFRQAAVRRFFIENALYWLLEYRFDGLRLDAVHAIDDRPFLRDLATAIRHGPGSRRHVHLVIENEHNDATMLPGPDGFDAQWADDFHHCVHVLLTGEREAYYEDFAAQPAALLARCLAEGFAYQGEPSPYASGRPRGTPSAHLPTTAFVISLQNHDQIGNRAFGERIGHLARPEALRAATVLLLLVPQIPLIFMGQEWNASRPFLFFASYRGELAEAVRSGRRREFARFAAFADAATRERIPDPNSPASFAMSVPDDSEIAEPEHTVWYRLHRELLAIRTKEIVPRLPGTESLGASAIGTAAVRARWRLGDGSALSVAANLGAEPVSCPVEPGRVLFSTGPPPQEGTLAAYTAIVTLDEPRDG